MVQQSVDRYQSLAECSAPYVSGWSATTVTEQVSSVAEGVFGRPI